MLAGFHDAGQCVVLPLPWSDRVAEDGFEERAEGELAIVAVGQQDHAGAASRELRRHCSGTWE